MYHLSIYTFYKYILVHRWPELSVGQTWLVILYRRCAYITIWYKNTGTYRPGDLPQPHRAYVPVGRPTLYMLYILYMSTRTYSAHSRRKIGRRRGGWRGGRRQNRSRCHRQKRGRQGSVERPGTGSLGHPAEGEDVSASAAGFEAERCARNPWQWWRRLSIPSHVTLSDDDSTRAANTPTQYYAQRKDSKADLLRKLRGQDNYCNNTSVFRQ